MRTYGNLQIGYGLGLQLCVHFELRRGGSRWMSTHYSVFHFGCRYER